jgi:hypothetical protein
MSFVFAFTFILALPDTLSIPLSIEPDEWRAIYHYTSALCLVESSVHSFSANLRIAIVVWQAAAALADRG